MPLPRGWHAAWLGMRLGFPRGLAWRAAWLASAGALRSACTLARQANGAFRSCRNPIPRTAQLPELGELTFVKFGGDLFRKQLFSPAYVAHVTRDTERLLRTRGCTFFDSEAAGT